MGKLSFKILYSESCFDSLEAKALLPWKFKNVMLTDGTYDRGVSLQVACCKAIGSLARIFPAPAEGPIRALTSALQNQNQDIIQVPTEAASALSKFASDENYLHMEHSKNIIQEGAVEHLVLLALNFGYSESQLSALELLCYLSLNVPDSEALARANIIHVLKSTIHANQLSQLFAKHETARPLINDAIAKLEVYQLRSSSFTIDMGNSSP